MSGLSTRCVFVLGVLVTLGSEGRCDFTQSHCGAYSPGDVVIGIVGSINSKVKDLQNRTRPEEYTCTDFDLIPFVHSLAAIHTIETINNSSFLPGIKLGYLMCDPCAYGTKALDCVEHMLAVNGSSAVLSDYSQFKPPVKVVLGERYSELSIPVARLLSLYMIPQISCTSTAPALSDKLRYPSFLRVVPSDIYQTKALVELIKRFEWDWVGVVTLDDDYGRAVLEMFLQDAKEKTVCARFQEVLPNYLGFINITQSIKQAADTIQNRSDVNVVLLILRPELVEMLFKEMIRRKITRTWIASDAWSTTRFLMKMKDINKVGDIFGFTFVTGNIPGFEDYLRNLRPSPGARNDFIREYKHMRFNCTQGQKSEHTSPSACNVTDPQEANDDYLVDTVDMTEAYSQRVAVYAIIQAIRELLNCSDTSCSGDADFLPWKLLSILRQMKFSVDNQTLSFNDKGEFESGYDLVMWKKSGDDRVLDVVGRFLIRNGKVEVNESKIQWSNNTVPISKCLKTCEPGEFKILELSTCCYECKKCDAGFNYELDQAKCQKCPEGSYSLSGSVACTKWEIQFLEWSSAYSIVVLIGTVIGILLLVSSLIYFVLHKNNSIIEDNIILSCIMMFGLMVSFGGLILFLGWPSDHHCRAQQVMYGLGFTLCVSCILTKAFVSFLAIMSISPERQRFFSKFNKPYIIVALLTGAQVLVCLFWFIFGSPKVEEKELSESVIKYRQCTQGSLVGFGAMHVYIAVLAVSCFFLAFKGRVDDTEPIVFSMLFHLFVWLCSIPLFITQTDQRTLIQVSAMMVSNYGVIVCHVLPKWHKIISKKIDDAKPKPEHDMSETSEDSGLSPEEELPSPSASSQTQLWSEDFNDRMG
ncbi:G-protein coupled receptor family C group 6 member A-like [Trichomycterus rosablanca]|uniref:G-protein coupled receptor family C group 6 member A-like n=1 Tax=Trichomycterus rosablanca TaxID=2290929 RepID=UPI002F353896